MAVTYTQSDARFLTKRKFRISVCSSRDRKTTFLASEVTYMATQLSAEDGPILWFNNEEEGEKVKLRLFQAALGIELVELFSDMDRNEERYLEITRNKIKLIDSANISRRQVENMCKNYNHLLSSLISLIKSRDLTEIEKIYVLDTFTNGLEKLQKLMVQSSLYPNQTVRVKVKNG